jgi:phosphoglycolate phosphatase-like HAD superfamily hydrolase
MDAQVAPMLSLRDFRWIFLDFDGVIKESVEAKSAAFVHLFEGFGDDVSKRVRSHHEANGGMSRFEKIPMYLGWAGEKETQKRVDE